MADVAILIPTFRRPRSLRRLLDALAALETAAAVEVVVADNDAERHEGLDLCLSIAPQYHWPLAAFCVEERGIAQARNGLVHHVLAHSSARFVAMLDDDEWPEPQWLEAFLQVQRETGADALRGTIQRQFEVVPSSWIAHCAGVSPIRKPTGFVKLIDGAGNVFVTRQCLEAVEAPCFDPAFALSGGEDSDFFRRLKRAGVRFAWSADAVCHEFVPASRLNLKWVLSRAYSVGNSDMRVLLKGPSTWRITTREWAKIAAAFVLFPVLQLACAPFPTRRAAALCKLFRAAGKAAAMFGSHFNEYATTHGH